MNRWLLPGAAVALWSGMLGHGLLVPGAWLPALLVGLGILGTAGVLASRERASLPALERAGLVVAPADELARVAPPRKVAAAAWAAVPLAMAGVLLIGASWSAFRHEAVATSALARMAPARLRVEGFLRTDPEPSRFGWSAVLRVSRVTPSGSTPVDIGGAVWLSGEGPPSWARRGDSVEIDGVLTRPDDPGFSSFLAERGLAGELGADSARRVGPSANAVMRMAGAVRQTLARSIARLFPPDQAGLLMGLALGDTSGISEAMTRDFRATGLTHLLAVSGENVAMILVPMVAMCSLLRMGRRGRFALLGGTVVFFVLLTGAEPSVLRAGIMAGIALTGAFAGRPTSAWPVFGGAVLLLLLIDPFLATSVGLQLSVTATCGMIALANPLAARLAFLPTPLALALGTTLGAQLGASPVLLSYFHWVPGSTILANLLAFPLISPALILGFAAAAVAPVLPPLAWLLARLAQVPMTVLTALADGMAKAPMPAITSSGGIAPLVGGTVVFLLIAWLLLGSSPRRRWVAAGAALLLPAFVLGAAMRSGDPEHLTVRFLDVGQGDAALISSPAGASILIDAGPDPDVVANRLAALGVRRLDLVVATHPHADHVEGFPEVFARFPVGTVLEPGCDEPSPSYTAFLAAIDDEDLEVVHPTAGDTFTVGDVRLDVLAPPGCYTGTHSDPNNDSIVLRLSHPDGTVLFPGDAEVESQEALLESGVDLSADVLKVPHHGGATSTPEFFDAVDEQLAVVSVGQPNDYGHPVPEVLDQIGAEGARILRTDESGEVVVSLSGRGPAVG